MLINTFFVTFFVILFGFLGGSIASFLGVLVERPTRQESLLPSSHCACGRNLKIYENVPVFGWLLTKGKAKCCGAVLPKRYLYSEVSLFLVTSITGLVFFLWLSGTVEIIILFLSIFMNILIVGLTAMLLKTSVGKETKISDFIKEEEKK